MYLNGTLIYRFLAVFKPWKILGNICFSEQIFYRKQSLVAHGKAISFEHINFYIWQCLRAILCRILILIFANKIDLAHKFLADFFQQLYYKNENRLFTSVNFFWRCNSFFCTQERKSLCTMRILSNFNRFGYTLAIVPLGNRFLPTEKQLFVFERFSQDKIALGTVVGDY